MALSTHSAFVSLAILAGFCPTSSGQEVLKIPPTPTEREYKSQEQIRREWATVYSKARVDAVAMLKAMQCQHGGWETLRDRWGGEIDALVIEALLENDVPLDDPVIVKGLRNLRLFRPQTTNIVALQTVALCKANDKRDWELLQRNVDWLLKAVKRSGREFQGWGYSQDSARGLSDNYTFEAVMALRVARLAGIRVDPRIWNEVRDYYLENQVNDGGWAWMDQRGFDSSPEPTVMALYGLYATDEMIGSSARSANAIKRGLDRLVESASVSDDRSTFFLYALSRLGEVHGELKFVNAAGKKREWFEDGTVWIINHQTPSGTFYVPRFNTAKTTATGLLFLAAGK